MHKAIRNPYLTASVVCLVLVLILITVGTLIVTSLSREDLADKSHEPLIAVAFFAFTFAFGLLVGAILTGVMARRVSRYIGYIRENDYQVRWSYQPDQWDAFQRAEFPLVEQDFRQIILLPTLIALPFGLAIFGGAMLLGNQPDLRSIVISGICTCVVFVVILAVAYYVRVVRQRAWGQKQRLSPPDTYFHPEFVHANGEFLLGLGNQRLIDIQLIVDEPARIKLSIQGAAPRGGTTLDIRRILVPSGELERARVLVASLQSDWQLASAN